MKRNLLIERGNLLLQLLYRLLLLSQEAAPSAQRQQQTASSEKPPGMLLAGSDEALAAATIIVPFTGLQGSQLQSVKESFPLQDVLPEQLILMVLQSLFFMLDKPTDNRALKKEEQRSSYLVVPLEGGLGSRAEPYSLDPKGAIIRTTSKPPDFSKGF